MLAQCWALDDTQMLAQVVLLFYVPQEKEVRVRQRAAWGRTLERTLSKRAACTGLLMRRGGSKPFP